MAVHAQGLDALEHAVPRLRPSALPAASPRDLMRSQVTTAHWADVHVVLGTLLCAHHCQEPHEVPGEAASPLVHSRSATCHLHPAGARSGGKRVTAWSFMQAQVVPEQPRGAGCRGAVHRGEQEPGGPPSGKPHPKGGEGRGRLGRRQAGRQMRSRTCGLCAAGGAGCPGEGATRGQWPGRRDVR